MVGTAACRATAQLGTVVHGGIPCAWLPAVPKPWQKCLNLVFLPHAGAEEGERALLVLVVFAQGGEAAGECGSGQSAGFSPRVHRDLPSVTSHWLQKPWHCHCTPWQDVEGEKCGLKSSLTA